MSDDPPTQNIFRRALSSNISIGNALILLAIIAAVVVLFVLALRTGVPGSADSGKSSTGIHDVEFARGLITLIFAGGTMLIALLLAIFVITSDSNDIEKRFSHGKEVFSILIGVFGTILGFYYGKSDGKPLQPIQIVGNADGSNKPNSDPQTNGNKPGEAPQSSDTTKPKE